MTTRSKVWLVLAALFAIGNLIAAGVALAWREPPHAGVHVLLALLGAFVVRWLWQRGAAASAPSLDAIEEPAISDRLAQLERSVDGVAIEVERIGESQRFMTRVLTEAAEPAPGAAPEPAARERVP
jgi:cytochrome c-type biogenesis protein CcmH/NrfG